MKRRGSTGRNLRPLMRRHLPAGLSRRLQEVGRLADQFGVSAFAVGGLPRDVLLGRETLDADVAVEGDGMAFARYLADRCGAGVKVFERFRTAYVVFPDHLKFDVANTRSSPGAYAGPAGERASCSIEQDLATRDLTINALAICLNAGRLGTLIDPSGGAADLKDGVLRVVSERCFVDDPARILRVLRFERRFGFQADRKTARFLKEAVQANLLEQLPDHRFGRDVLLLLSEQGLADSVRRMSELDLLRFIHPALTWTPRLGRLLKALAKTMGWWSRTFPDRPLDRAFISFLALTEALSGTDVETACKRLALSEPLAAKARTIKKSMDPVSRRLSNSRPLKPSEAYRLLAGLPDEGLALCIVKASAARAVRVVADHLTRHRNIRLSISGKTLASMGLPEGPRYRVVLDRVLDAKLDGRVTTRKEEQALARQLVAQMSG